MSQNENIAAISAVYQLAAHLIFRHYKHLLHEEKNNYLKKKSLQ